MCWYFACLTNGVPCISCFIGGSICFVSRFLLYHTTKAVNIMWLICLRERGVPTLFADHAGHRIWAGPDAACCYMTHIMLPLWMHVTQFVMFVHLHHETGVVRSRLKDVKLDVQKGAPGGVMNMPSHYAFHMSVLTLDNTDFCLAA